MKYEVKNKNDIITGAYIIIRIPENELDYNAFNTIQADCPEFILPFHYKCENGEIELVYKVGRRCKLQYFSGDLSPDEYTRFWQSLLEPLLICGDWFMNPCSFLLNTEFLYYDKNKKAVSYIYIPTTNNCCGYEAFYEMAADVSKLITVSDAVLENKVLRAIMKDFNPLEFLQMLKTYIPNNNDVALCSENNIVEKSNITDENNQTGQEMQPEPEIQAEPAAQMESFADDTPEIPFITEVKKREKETSGYRIFSSRSKRKKAVPDLSGNQFAEEIKSGDIYEGLAEIIPEIQNQDDGAPETQSTSIIRGTAGLRYVGRANLPQAIHVAISEGEIFSVGRFDAAIGKKQSDFEFDKRTKAVSRRHAVIERNTNGYNIIDLSSSAGTYVNDKKIPPNTPYELETGCRVLFGNAGADYVWEIN